MPQSMEDQQSVYPILEPKTVPITGNIMIEASAGTGKTYTITLLVLRLLLGLNVDPKPKKLPEILIVTFTNSATAELKERIYSRIVDLKQAFFAHLMGFEIEDSALYELIEYYLQTSELTGIDEETALETAINLLNEAESSIDQASIFTIHAFSQRLLKENALDLGQAFNFELETDLSGIYREAVYHFWREECYPLDFELSRFASFYFNIPISENSGNFEEKNLFSKIRPLIINPSLINRKLFTEDENLHAIFEAQLVLINSVKHRAKQEFTFADFENIIETAGLKKTSYRSNLILGYHSDFMSWAGNDSPGLFKNYDKFTLDFMESRLGKGGDLNRIPKNLQILFEDLVSIAEFHKKVFHYSAFKVVSILKMLKQNAGILGFDDLLRELNQKTMHLTDAFMTSLHSRFRAVMIDEFQDTDDLQLSTFRRLFFDYKEIPFVMIGDPKQAIYGFRGADINAYLSIKEDVDQIYTLNTNYRSGLLQVNAVNSLFGMAENPFLVRGIPFISIKTPESSSFTEVQVPKIAPSGMTVLEYLPSDDEMKFDKKGKGSISNPYFRAQISTACAKEILTLLESGQLATEKGNRPIMPEDITILVRSGTQAASIQKGLRDAGLNSVYLSEQNSVFDPESSIVTDLYIFLKSLVFKHETAILMQSLGSVLYGFSVTEFEEVKQSPALLEELLLERNSLNEIWMKQGILAMLRAFMVRNNRLAKLLKLDNGERLASDLFHLGELLQRESFSNQEALLLWLHEKMFGFEAGEGAEIRLESDFKTIQIMTIHKSKGLEFPVVFLPFGNFKTQAKKEGVYIHPQSHNKHYVFSGDATEEEGDFFTKEVLAEDIRLLYVALTRAKYHTYIGFCQKLSPSSYENTPFAYLMNFNAKLEEPGVNYKTRFSDVFTRKEVLQKDLVLLEEDRENENQVIKTAAIFTRKIAPLWRFTSFSNLSYNAKTSYFTPLLEDELEFDAPLMPENEHENYDSNDHHDDGLEGIYLPEISLFPKGAITGNFIHELLEDYSPEALKDRALLTKEVTKSFSHLIREETLPLLVDELEIWLYHILNAKLPKISAQPALSNLAQAPEQAGTLAKILQGSRNIKELEFIFPIETPLTKQALNLLLREHFVRESDEELQFETIQGFLRGFIDLFFEADGQYYVADYKSNTLGERKQDYTEKQMMHSIKHAHYDLQYLIYTVAAVKFLRNIIPDFDYDRDFGGVFYFYLRGMKAGSEQAIYFVKPDYDLVLKLIALFDEDLESEFESNIEEEI